mmetsp:Transcript_15102/g.18411  ORF Transcript_15102/g.18411 Transcript_15102/m.18411 type:complete len:350 (+) Transcript_15102:233-1282(+)
MILFIHKIIPSPYKLFLSALLTSTFIIINANESNILPFGFTAPTFTLPKSTNIYSSITTTHSKQHTSSRSRRTTTFNNNNHIILYSTPDDDGPSDYDPQAVLPTEKQLIVDIEEGDAIIRDELKRELLLMGSITNRGQYASKDEKNIIVDLVTQLEALNPTPDPASECSGEWDLCLSSTQAFRSSPFFQSIRAIFGSNDDNNDANSNTPPSISENFFNLHSQATSVGKVARVRQFILDDGSFISEVDLEVGLMGGIPLSMKGTVVTTASYDITGPESWDLKVKTTQVKKSNIPFLDQLLDDYPAEVPVGSVYETIRGSVPVAILKTFYVDEAMRITRDQDDNFYVFCRC